MCTTLALHQSTLLFQLFSNTPAISFPYAGTANYAATNEEGVDLPSYSANRSSGGRLLDSDRSGDNQTTHNRIHNMSTDSESRV